MNMAKSINNMNTLNALIKDENMAHTEYYLLAKGKDVPAAMQKRLLQMSKDELKHRNNLIEYRNWLKKQRK